MKMSIITVYSQLLEFLANTIEEGKERRHIRIEGWEIRPIDI